MIEQAGVIEKQTQDKQGRTAEEKIEQKLRAIQNPNCIVLAPHVRDLHFLAQMLYAFDRGINTMRIKAGVEIPLAVLDEKNKKINACRNKIGNFITSLNSHDYYLEGQIRENADTKQILARSKNTYTFIPKTDEARVFAQTFKALDAAFVEYKVRYNLASLTELENKLAMMREIVSDFHALITDLSELTRKQYTAPKGLLSYISQNEHGESPGNGKKTSREKKA